LCKKKENKFTVVVWNLAAWASFVSLIFDVVQFLN